MNSIGTNNNAKKKVVLAGKNKLKVFILYFSTVIIFIPIKTEKESVNVTIRWLVVVKLYGSKPIKLLKRIKLNKTEISGKYFSLFVEMISEISCAVTSATNSILFCHTLGITKK